MSQVHSDDNFWAKRQIGDMPLEQQTPDSETSLRSVSEIQGPVGAAKMKPHHFRAIFGFCILVIIPVLMTTWYLFKRAADQYASTVEFTVRQVENNSSAIDLIGGISTIGKDTSSESDIVFKFIQSKQLVAAVDDAMDIRTLYSRHFEADPLFSFDNNGTIEDLTAYWSRMVSIYHDTNTDLIEMRVRAFSSEDALQIAQEILKQSEFMINRLNVAAQNDTTKYSRQELNDTIERLKLARKSVSQFRIENQMVDPNADLQGQMGVLTSLQQRLADALIELDLLDSITNPSDPRSIQAKRKIQVIGDRISDERAKLSSIDGESGTFSSIFGRFEALKVDLEFSETSYLNALTTYDNSLAEARRENTYLAAFVEPTMAERSEYPRRFEIIGLTCLFLFLAWSVLTLVFYSMRDRK